MIFIDANIFMYAAGTASPQKGACLQLLERIANGGSASNFATSVEVLQELLHRYRAINRADVGFQLFDATVNLGIEILLVDLRDMAHARRIMQQIPKLPARDAVHVAVALRHRAKVILSYDRDFDLVQEIKRGEPGGLKS